MSGSPVYIDGRLIGAVSYSIGSFPNEAIAGITPIAEMKDATDVVRRPAAAQARIELPLTRESLAAALRPRSRGSRRSAQRPADVQVVRPARGLGRAARRDAAADRRRR